MLRVAAHAAPVAQPQYADANAFADSSTDVQGSSRLESISSWGMIVVVGLAMFVFIGILASKPHDARTPGTEAADSTDSFAADVQLKGSSIVIENKNDFDWPATTFTFRSGVTRYSYRLDRVPHDGKTAIPLGDFISTRGAKFSPASAPNPREVTVRVTGHGSATARL